MLISAAGSQMLLAVVGSKDMQTRQNPQTFHHSTQNVSGGQDAAPPASLKTWGKAADSVRKEMVTPLTNECCLFSLMKTHPGSESAKREMGRGLTQ